MNLTAIDFTKISDDYIIPWGINLLIALVILFIGRSIAKVMVNGVVRLMHKAKVDEALVGFLSSILSATLLVVVIMAALEQLGINTNSIIAVLAAAGLAVGLALKDSLSNFAAGVMLIIFQPFKKGDFIEAGGVTGVVEWVRVFSTLLRTPDNREITVPNSKIYGDIITNFSAHEQRRIDMVIGIGYNDDIKAAKTLIESILHNDERILNEPAADIMVLELADSSINLAVRPWVRSTDYGKVRSDLLETIKETFDQHNISIPYPQRDVHLHQINA